MHVRSVVRIGMALTAVLLVAASAPAAKKKIEKRDDLPRHSYTLPMSGSEIDRFEAPDGAMTRRMTAPRENWPAEPLRVTLTFEQGVLTSIDGERGPGPAMLHALNRHFGAYGVDPA